MIETLHVGPDVYSFGGTQTVIRIIRDNSIGADRTTILATWTGPRHRRNAQLMARAAAVIGTLDRTTIVHFHISNGGAWLREGTLAHLACARGLRIVVTLHGYEFPAYARAHPRFVRSVLRCADHVICLSNESSDEVTALLAATPVTVLANPIAVDAGAAPANQTCPVAVFAGTIGLRKGVDVLVEAWRRLLASDVAGECRIVGPIDDFIPPKLERMSVEGPIHPYAVRDLLRSARVVVLPSRAEGMPMILTEALAAGRPFVATPVGGTNTITPDPEMLVPVGDAAALADAVGRYLTHPEEAARAGQRGQRYITQTRSPEVIDRKLREIYSAIL